VLARCKLQLIVLTDFRTGYFLAYLFIFNSVRHVILRRKDLLFLRSEILNLYVFLLILGEFL